MPSIYSLLPEPDVLLSLEPEELAGYVMEHLNSLHESEQNSLNRYNFSLDHTVREYPTHRWNEIKRALMEAWIWLEPEGLLAPKPGQQGDWYFITRRGRKLWNHVDVAALRKADLLPRAQLHPLIAQGVWSSFLRGAYDTAVFEAFREVEVAVRTAGKFAPTDLGTDLMRKAFAPSTGPLVDPSLPTAEQEALSHLFAGAIGYYKNPFSHRHMTITDPAEAVEMIVLASHLLRIVDSRTH